MGVHVLLLLISRNETLAIFAFHITPSCFLLASVFMAKCPDDCSLHRAHQRVSLQCNHWPPSARAVSDTPAFKLSGRVPRLDVIAS